MPYHARAPGTAPPSLVEQRFAAGIAQHGVNHLFGCVPFFETRPRVTVTGIGRSHNRPIGRLVHVLRQQRGRRAGTQALQGPVPVPAR